MKNANIDFILVQIDEAHTKKWISGTSSLVEPQTDLSDRLQRANDFKSHENCPMTVLVDDWENNFANIFQAWPDKYYCVDNEKKVVMKSTYGKNSDALIDVDCVEYIRILLNK